MTNETVFFKAFYFNIALCTYCGGTAVCDIKITGIILTLLSTKCSKKPEVCECGHSNIKIRIID